jgi:TonB family protein
MIPALGIVAKTTVLLIAAAAITALLYRASASMRHTLWLVAIICTLVVPIASITLPSIELPVLPAIPAVASASVTIVTTSVPDVLATASSGAHANATVVALSVWLIGAAFGLARLLLGGRAIRRFNRQARPATGVLWPESNGVRIRLSHAEVPAMTWGIFRYTILLPASAAQWPYARKRAVIAHELSHVERNDGVTQLLVQFALSIYWFNPLMWYAEHRARGERERACDDAVLRAGTAPEEYAQHLLEIARGLRPRANVHFAALSMAHTSQLETRIRSILKSGARRMKLSRTSAICLLAVTIGASVLLSALTLTTMFPGPPILMARPLSAPPPAKPPAPPQRTRIAGGNNASTITPPRVLSVTAPIYTDEALAARIEGTVTLEASVDANGKASVLRIAKGLGYGLDERAIGAVIDWKFAPALRDGLPATAVTEVDVDFRLPQETPVRLGRGGINVRPPTVISRVEPKYTDQAREAHLSGTVVLFAIVRADGSVDIIHVVQSLGLGLDESAIDALKQWKFRPGMRDDRPVDVGLNIEVNFVADRSDIRDLLPPYWFARPREFTLSIGVPGAAPAQ